MGCGWSAALEVPVGEGWRSGYYAVTLTSGDERADAFFVVRSRPQEAAPILMVLSTTTYDAYNDWGGPSLYTGGTQVSWNGRWPRGSSSSPNPHRRKMQPLPGPGGALVLRVGGAARVIGVERRRRMVELGAAVPALGRAERVRRRRRDLHRPGGTPPPAGRPSDVRLGRTRRVLVVGDARPARRVHRRRRQRRDLQWEHVLLAGPVR